MDQYSEEAMICLYSTKLLQIPDHLQILVEPTNLRVTSGTPEPFWQDPTASPLLKLKYFILCRTDLNISNVISFPISQANHKFNSVHFCLEIVNPAHRSRSY